MLGSRTGFSDLWFDDVWTSTKTTYAQHSLRIAEKCQASLCEAWRVLAGLGERHDEHGMVAGSVTAQHSYGYGLWATVPCAPGLPRLQAVDGLC